MGHDSDWSLPGGGQLTLGVVVTVISASVLLCLGWLDRQIPRQERAMVAIAGASVADIPSRIANLLAPFGCRALFQKFESKDGTDYVTLWFEITWKRVEAAGPPLDLINVISQAYPVQHFELTSEARH